MKSLKVGEVTPADPHSARLAADQAGDPEPERGPDARAGAQSGCRQGLPREGPAARWSSTLTKLREQAIIEWKNEEVHKAYDAQLARPTTPTTTGAELIAADMKIGPLPVEPALGVAPMAGMTDTAFRRLVKRHGGCGLVVTEMVSSEGLVRGIDRTLEYAEYTEEERPVSIQIFGGDPGEDGGRGADRRGHGRRRRRHQHGLPGAEDREAQRRLQPDARAVARGRDRRRRWPGR